MGRQKKNKQSKGMEDSLLKELNEMEVTKLSDTAFKIMVTKMLKELTDNHKELSENYISMKKEIETINKNQEEMNNKISEIKTHQKDLQAGWMKQRIKSESWRTKKNKNPR